MLRRKTDFYTGVLFVMVVARLVAHGCQCREYGTPVCVQYQRADSVFIALVMKIDQQPNQHGQYPEDTKVRFMVEEVLKGKIDREVIDTQGNGADCKITYEVGKRYLIYNDEYDAKTKMIGTSYCNGSTNLEGAQEDLAYIRGRSTHPPKSAVLGRILINRYEPIVGASVEVFGSDKTLKAVTDERGDYNLTLPKEGNYEVKVTIPFSGGALEYVGDYPLLTLEEAREKQSIFRYKITLAKGECSYKQINTFKVDLKATASISGKITDASDQPVAHLTLYLYPASKDQDFSGGNYEFVGTKEDGSYTFAGLKPGDYYFGINLAHAPEVGSPYPRTIYPGVDGVNRAQVIHLEQGQSLTDLNLRLPPKLVERVITGVIEWPDGKPVTKFSPDSAEHFGPLVSIRDPDRLSYPLTPRRPDGSITTTTDTKGNFSFIGFEGYSYVIHVHAIDANDKVMHAKHVKITVGEKNPPVRLVLSIPGYGEDVGEIVREMNEP